MPIRNNILISIIVSACVAVGGCALLAFWQSRKAAVEDFSANAGGRLRLAGQYLSELVGNSKGIEERVRCGMGPAKSTSNRLEATA